MSVLICSGNPISSINDLKPNSHVRFCADCYPRQYHNMYITYPSALEFWMNAQCQRTLSFSFPRHIAVRCASLRKQNKNYVCHVLPKHLPTDSFVRISESLFVASPELCFLMAAAEYTLPEIVRLGNDLCGIYMLDTKAGYGQVKREPVTDPEKISAYLQQIENVHGIRKATIAIQYVCGRSNSPMESCLAAIAVLPLCHGGFGLEKPLLNHSISLTPEAAKLLGRSECCPDMAWVTRRVLIEYNSNMTHLDANQHYQDAKRSNAMTLSGYTLISVTAEQLRNYRSIEDLFLIIMNALGVRIYKDRLDKYIEKRWSAIRSVFFKPAAWLKVEK